MNIPEKIKTLFASATGALKSIIPEIGTVDDTEASMQMGFPPRTMSQGADKIPPTGQDMNGILYKITEAIRYLQAGGIYSYDNNFAQSIGGYPLGAILISADGSKLWQNQTAGNTNNPDSDSTNWTELCTVDALSSAISEIRGTAGSSAVLSDYLPLAGGEMIGAIQSTYEGVSAINGSGIGNLNIVTTDDLYADESDSSYEIWRPIVNVKDSQNKRWLVIETFIKRGKHGFNLSTRSAADDAYSELQGFSDGSFKCNGKEIERVDSLDIVVGGGWIRYESGLQICGGRVYDLKATADTKITFPKAFTVAPTVVMSRSSGTSTTVDIAVWKRGEPTTTYFNVYATNATNMTYIAFGRWK